MNAAIYRAASAYANVDLETNVGGANPHRLILMLFEAAMLAVSKAKGYMEAGNLSSKGMSISKAIQVIDNGLKASLDEERGGDIARQLAELYDYMCRKLLHASMRNDPVGLEEVSKLLSEIREAWSAIGKKVSEPQLSPARPQAVAA
jgi:flagellar secretion chaperone FliS